MAITKYGQDPITIYLNIQDTKIFKHCNVLAARALFQMYLGSCQATHPSLPPLPVA